MALKDWKKGDFVNHLFEYESRTKNLIINAIDTSHSMFKVKYPIRLEIFKINPYKRIIYKIFTTKSQALEFAMSYMRAH